MGLYDRDYMNSAPAHAGDSRKMLWALIIINIIAFFIRQENMQLSVGSEFTGSNILQLFTAGFYHKEFFNLFFNMWGLYIFGVLVTPHVSSIGILALYLTGSVSGNLLFLLCNLGTPGSFYGAIGAVCAMMTAAAMLEPERKFMLIFMPFSPIKITTMVICYTILDIFFGIANGLGYLSHLTGFVGGYIVMKILFGNNVAWDPIKLLNPPNRDRRKPFSRPRSVNPDAQRTQSSSHSGSDMVTQKELDELLDKLSEGGINSLSDYELDRLKKARRQMRGEE